MLTHVVRYIQNSASEVRWGCRTPFDLGWIYRSHVPENAIALATEFVRTGKLLFQFFRHKVILVPELHDPEIGNS